MSRDGADGTAVHADVDAERCRPGDHGHEPRVYVVVVFIIQSEREQTLSAAETSFSGYRQLDQELGTRRCAFWNLNNDAFPRGRNHVDLLPRHSVRRYNYVRPIARLKRFAPLTDRVCI